jgi:hypothetical protein
MINFREMVLEAIDSPDGVPLATFAASTNTKKGFFDLIKTIKDGFHKFNDSYVKTPGYYTQAWLWAGQKFSYTSVVNHEELQITYPMLDFLFLVKEMYNKKDANWGTDIYSINDVSPKHGLKKIEQDFLSGFAARCTAGVQPADRDTLFNYTPFSATLKSVHQKIKDTITSAGLIGRKTIKNCADKGYTVRQAIYLATQLRQSNMPIISSIPAANKSIDDFLYQSVIGTNSYLGGAVTPSESGKGFKAAVKSKVSAIIKPKTIPTAVKDMVETLISFMESVKIRADVLTPPPLPPKPQMTSDEIKESLNKVLNEKVEALSNGTSEIEKEIYSKLTNMLNHVPGEKDWVGKLQATASGLKSVESALGIKM